MGNARRTATVDTLTAEVRVLMVGSRQVTMSVYGQLDYIDPALIEPFGRVSPKSDFAYLFIHVVGRDGDGNLVRSFVPREPMKLDNAGRIPIPGWGHYTYLLWNKGGDDERKFLDEVATQWPVLPLIVLAGLR